MNRKQTEEIKDMLRSKNSLTETEKKLEIELELREMIMSCFTYGGDIYTSVCMNMVSDYYHKPYANEYIDKLGEDRVREIYNEQKDFFENKCRVIHNVYTDYEGCTYNSRVEEEQEKNGNQKI